MELGNIIDHALTLALRKQIDQAEIFAVKKKVLSVRMSNKQILEGKGNYDAGIAVRLLYGRALGCSFASGFSEEAITSAIDNAYKIAKIEKNKSELKSFAEPQHCPEISGLLDEKLYDIEADQAVELASRMMEGAVGFSRRVQDFSGSLNIVCSDSAIKNSLGVELYDRGTSVYGIAYASAKDGAVESEGYDEAIFRKISRFNPEDCGRRSAEMAVSGLGARKLESGKYAVVFDPQAASQIVARLDESVLGSFVHRGISPFAGKIGEEVAVSDFTLHDGGRYPGGLESRKFDDEGVPTNNTPVIEKGIMNSYLYDLQTAQMEDRKSTGNGNRNINIYRSYEYSLGGFGQISGRSYAFPPYSAITNPAIEQGDVSRDDLIKDTASGVLIAWNHYGQVMSTKTGDYTAICRGGNHMIEHGELKYPLQKFRFHDTIPSMIKRITGIGNNVEQKGTWVFGHGIAPSIRVEKVPIIAL